MTLSFRPLAAFTHTETACSRSDRHSDPVCCLVFSPSPAVLPTTHRVPKAGQVARAGGKPVEPELLVAAEAARLVESLARARWAEQAVHPTRAVPQALPAEPTAVVEWQAARRRVVPRALSAGGGGARGRGGTVGPRGPPGRERRSRWYEWNCWRRWFRRDGGRDDMRKRNRVRLSALDELHGKRRRLRS